MTRPINGKRQKSQILQHAEMYSLCTTASVVRQFDRSNGWARRLLGQMLRDGQIFRHVFRSADGHRRIHYYSRRQKPMKVAEFRKRFSILHFAHIRQPNHSLVAKEVFAGLSQRMCTVARVPVEPYVPCYMEQGCEEQPQRLSLIRVAPARALKNLNHAMSDLQTFTGGDRFRLWVYFARQNLVSITYLLPGDNHVDELTRWLVRRPIVSRVGSLQAVVPVHVVRGVYV